MRRGLTPLRGVLILPASMLKGTILNRCTVVVMVAAGVFAQGCSRETVSAAPQPTPRNTETVAARPTEGADQVVARVGGRVITMKQLQQPLVEGYGLNILLNLVQLELARDLAQRAGLTVSPQDILAERDLTLALLFPDAEKDQYDTLFDQFLQQQRLSKPEFQIVLETNALLRKIVEPKVRGKVSESNLEEAYKTTYGETVRVRHIQCANMTEIVEAKRRLAGGEAFAQVAEELSRNARTRPLGGELPPFSRASTAFPQAFRDAAFALKVGDVSDPVQADGYFHLILLEKRIQPKAVKFEDVKESLRTDLEAKLVQAGVQQQRSALGQEALRTLKVEEPVLREQYARKLEAREAQVRDRDEIRRELERQRQKQIEEQEAGKGLTTAPAATQPAAMDVLPTPPTPEPAPAATMPATTQP